MARNAQRARGEQGAKNAARVVHVNGPITGMLVAIETAAYHSIEHAKRSQMKRSRLEPCSA
jgi:hypothetical protein